MRERKGKKRRGLYMESWMINGMTLEYDEDGHLYVCDGMIVPSVTQILERYYGSKYDRVDERTLQRAAERGTRVHKAIEEFCKFGVVDGSEEVRNFKFLLYKYGFRVFESETPIIIHKDGEPIAAGRLDLVLDAGDATAIADIKTMATLDRERLAAQLNLYRVGYIQSYRIGINKLYGVHLRDDKRKLVNIPINERLAWEILEGVKR